MLMGEQGMIVPGACFNLFPAAASGELVLEIQNSNGALAVLDSYPYERTGAWPYAHVYIYPETATDMGHLTSVTISGSSDLTDFTGWEVYSDAYELLGTALWGVPLDLGTYTGNVLYFDGNGVGDGSASGTVTVTGVTLV